jgi:hypothetical protein
VEQDTIRVLDVRRQKASTVVLRNPEKFRQQGWAYGISWASSGRAFILTTREGLFYVDPAGQARELYAEALAAPRYSPDGRHIAFTQVNSEQNAWLLEGF